MATREEAIRLAEQCGIRCYDSQIVTKIERLIQLVENKAYRDAVDICRVEAKIQTKRGNFNTAHTINFGCEAVILALVKE